MDAQAAVVLAAVYGAEQSNVMAKPVAARWRGMEAPLDDHAAPLPQNARSLPGVVVDFNGSASRPHWSEQEVELLRHLRAEGIAEEEIAKLLGRSRRAIRSKALRVTGVGLRAVPRTWTECEVATILRLHADGAACAEIAEAVPGRSVIAVYRKLSNLVGPAPLSAAKLTEKSTPTNESLITQRPPEPPLPPNQQPPLQPPPKPSRQAVPATLDAIVCWLRSRDFIVLHTALGWKVDNKYLNDETELVAFVNVRRARLQLPPFTLTMPAISFSTKDDSVGRRLHKFNRYKPDV